MRAAILLYIAIALFAVNAHACLTFYTVEDQTVQEYKIIAHDTSAAMTKAINKLITQGWVLYGPPCANAKFIYQAVVREHDAND